MAAALARGNIMRIRFDIPQYSDALRKLFESACDSIHGSDQLLQMMPLQRITHSGPIRNVPGPEPLDHPLALMEQVAEIPKETIRDTTVDSFTEILHSFTEGVTRQRAAHMFRMFDSITEKTGNHIAAEGNAVTYDRLTVMLELAEHSFDDDGKPQGVIILPPEAYAQLFARPPTNAEYRRLEEVMERKKAEYFAQKRTRRLSR